MEFSNLVPFAIFGAVTVAIFAVVNLFSKKASRADERLDELKDPSRRARAETDSTKGKGMGAMLEKAAPALSKALQPKTELEVNKLKVSLSNAGFNTPAAPQIYLSAKLISLATGVILGGGIGLLSWGITQKGLYSVVIGGGLGFYIPSAVIWFLKRRRIEQIFLSLPDALDLLVVCVEAGLGLDAGLRKVSEEMRDSARALCDELDLANLQLQMGRARRDVLHDLGVRSGVDDMRSLAAILIQADKFGSSIAQALRVQSDSMRIKRKQLAEEKAAKTAVKMIFPLVLFIFPGIFVILVGPAAIMLIDGLLAV